MSSAEKLKNLEKSLESFIADGRAWETIEDDDFGKHQHLTNLLDEAEHLVTRLRSRGSDTKTTIATTPAETSALLQNIVDSIPHSVFWKDRNSVFLGCNQQFARDADLESPLEILGKTDFDLPWKREESIFYRQCDQEVMTNGVAIRDLEETQLQVDGRVAFVLTSKVPLRDETGRVFGILGIYSDITDRKNMEEELRRSIEANRRAGMAQIATGILHNVGNVLNSVNISATMIENISKGMHFECLKRSGALCTKLAEEFDENSETRKKMRLLADYLVESFVPLNEERNKVVCESSNLHRHISHIRNVIATQQKYARVSGVDHFLSLESVIVMALDIIGADLDRDAIEIVRAFDATRTISADKHKILQVLLNLIANANDALMSSHRPDKRLILRTSDVGADRVLIEVLDNGVGIAPGTLGKIFSFGFTTKLDGFGFGLHASATIATELGGTLFCESAGIDQGASFVLELPVTPRPHAPKHLEICSPPRGRSLSPLHIQ